MLYEILSDTETETFISPFGETSWYDFCAERPKHTHNTIQKEMIFFMIVDSNDLFMQVSGTQVFQHELRTVGLKDTGTE